MATGDEVLAGILTADAERRRPFIDVSSFTRPGDTAQYGIGDLVANNTSAGSVVVPKSVVLPARTGVIRGGLLRKSTNAATAASFRVHLFTEAPTPANGDNGALALTAGDWEKWIGALDVTLAAGIFANSLVGFALPATSGRSELLFGTQAQDPTLHWLVEARAAYTPGNAEIFSFRPHMLFA